MEVNTKNPKYEKLRPIWDRVKDFCEGQDAVKARKQTYLPAMPSQMQPIEQAGFGQSHRTLYDLFLDKATVWPGASKTLKAYTGILSRKAPRVEAPEEYIDIFSLDGESIYTVSTWAAKGVMKYGVAGLLVDFPENTDRPFAVKYSAYSILDWKYAIGNGGRSLSHVSLVERWKDGEADEIIHLNIELVGDEENRVPGYVVRKYELQKVEGKQEKQWVLIGTGVPLMNGQPIPFIPFVPITEDGQVLDYDYPMLTDVTNLNMAHYQNDAEYRNALTFAGRPTPCVAGLIQAEGQNKITLGTSSVLQFEQGGSWGMLGLDDASGINAIRQAGQDLQADMAVAGSRALMQDPNGVEAAQTAAIHREGEHGQLSNIANVVSGGITQVLELMKLWANIPGDVSFEMNTDFNPLQVDSQTLSVLWQMYMGGTISFELFYYNLQRGELTPDLRTAEEEKESAAADRRELEPQNTIDLDAE
jgi:hypothetical protein